MLSILCALFSAKCALCAPYLPNNTVKNVYKIQIHPFTPKITCLPSKQKSWKNRAKCALCKMCTVRTLIAKQYSKRMFTKSTFTPSHQKSSVYLQKQKLEKQSKMCALQNVHCAHPNCQKIQYKNVYEI